MRQELKADLALIGVTVFWGTSFPIMSIVLKSMPPYSFIAIRNMIGAVLLTAVFYKSFRKINLKDIKAAFLIGLSLLIGMIFQVVGLIYTTPSKSGFITGLNVVFVPLILAFIYRKFPDLKTLVGIILSVIGLALMSINGSMGINFGDILTLLGAIAFSFQILLVDKYGKEVDAGLLTSLELFVVGLLAFVPAIGIERLQFEMNVFVVGAILFTAVFSTAIAMWVQNKMQPYTNPTHAAIIYLAEPVFAAIFSAFIGDKLTGKSLAGGLLILLGTLIISIKFKSNRD
jgi:drug/metabolite transporter (DMT)-like permease